MQVVDPGHRYLLDTFDGDGFKELLVFMKREGVLYPGNVGSYSGTNLQEVLRACCDRLSYVDGQIPDADTRAALFNVEMAIWYLEKRAARRHNREFEINAGGIEFQPTCAKCGHIGCLGQCRVKPPAGEGRG